MDTSQNNPPTIYQRRNSSKRKKAKGKRTVSRRLSIIPNKKTKTIRRTQSLPTRSQKNRNHGKVEGFTNYKSMHKFFGINETFNGTQQIIPDNKIKFVYSTNVFMPFEMTMSQKSFTYFTGLMKLIESFPHSTQFNRDDISPERKIYLFVYYDAMFDNFKLEDIDEIYTLDDLTNLDYNTLIKGNYNENKEMIKKLLSLYKMYIDKIKSNPDKYKFLKLFSYNCKELFTPLNETNTSNNYEYYNLTKDTKYLGHPSTFGSFMRFLPLYYKSADDSPYKSLTNVFIANSSFNLNLQIYQFVKNSFNIDENHNYLSDNDERYNKYDVVTSSTQGFYLNDETVRTTQDYNDINYLVKYFQENNISIFKEKIHRDLVSLQTKLLNISQSKYKNIKNLIDIPPRILAGITSYNLTKINLNIKNFSDIILLICNMYRLYCKNNNMKIKSRFQKTIYNKYDRKLTHKDININNNIFQYGIDEYILTFLTYYNIIETNQFNEDLRVKILEHIYNKAFERREDYEYINTVKIFELNYEFYQRPKIYDINHFFKLNDLEDYSLLYDILLKKHKHVDVEGYAVSDKEKSGPISNDRIYGTEEDREQLLKNFNNFYNDKFKNLLKTLNKFKEQKTINSNIEKYKSLICEIFEYLYENYDENKFQLKIEDSSGRLIVKKSKLCDRLEIRFLKRINFFPTIFELLITIFLHKYNFIEKNIYLEKLFNFIFTDKEKYDEIIQEHNIDLNEIIFEDLNSLYVKKKNTIKNFSFNNTIISIIKIIETYYRVEEINLLRFKIDDLVDLIYKTIGKSKKIIRNLMKVYFILYKNSNTNFVENIISLNYGYNKKSYTYTNYISLSCLENYELFNINFIKIIKYLINSYNEKDKFLGHYLTTLDEYNKLFIYSNNLLKYNIKNKSFRDAQIDYVYDDCLSKEKAQFYTPLNIDEYISTKSQQSLFNKVYTHFTNPETYIYHELYQQ